METKGATEMDTLRFGREIRWLFQAALLIFLVTIALGMAQGLKLIDFLATENENQAFAHLHSGALGWGTLGMLAAVLWLYGGTNPRHGEERWIGWTSGVLIVGVPIFVAAWWLDSWPLLAAGGSLALLGIIMCAGWIVREAARIGYRNLTTPQLGAVLALVTLVVGSALGVLIAIGEATGSYKAPETVHTAHAGAQETGYLLILAVALLYWRLRGDDRTRGGTWMVWLLFAGGASLTAAALANAIQATILYIPLDIAAFAILLVLAWRQVTAPGWLAADSRRHYAIAVWFGIVALALFVVIIAGIVAGLWEAAPESIPGGLLPANTHATFVGMVTNLLFGLLFELNRGRRAIWPWSDHVVFWGLNLAVAAFIVALLLEADDLFKFITPVLGLSIFVGIVVHTLRLWSHPSGATAATPRRAA